MNGAAVAEPKQAPPKEAQPQTQYAVAAPGADQAVERAAKRIAIFVAHGMGQQIPFETLDAIAESLRVYDTRLTGRRDKPISNTIKTGPDQWLQRIELKL